MHKEIDSPLSIFNNVQIKITHEFEKILFSNMIGYKHDKNKSVLSMRNLIVFENDSINLLGYIKLMIHQNELFVKIQKPLNKDELQLINNIYINWDNVSLNFFKYIQMYNNIAKNFDEVPTQLINNIINEFNNKLKNFVPDIELDNLLIPYKNKINTKYDDSNYVNNILYGRFQYLLKIKILNKTNFEYKIIRVLSSELKESKNELNNLRFLEQDIIKKATLKTNQIKSFIENLYYYGELI